MSVTTTFMPQGVADWAKLFPRQITENYTSSVTFMKQLTVVAVSTISYLKNILPDDSYTIENFAGIRLRVLKKKCRDEMAQFISTAMAQAFEAFEKKYLHQLVLCFYDTECKIDNLLEYHIFEYAYNPDGATMSVHSKTQGSDRHTTSYTFDNVKEKTVHLIKACVVIMQACQMDTHVDYEISFRLYYNDAAPEGYQARGFAAEGAARDHVRAAESRALALGAVRTPFHSLTLRTYMRDNADSSCEALPSQNPPVMSLNEQGEFETSSEQRSEAEGVPQVLCPCNKFDTDDDIIECHYCHTLQHAACFGLLRANAVPLQLHCCTACSDADASRPPTDRRLASLSVKKRECLCVVRRALCWLRAHGAASARQLARRLALSPANTAKLVKLLHSHGIIQHYADTDLVTPLQVVQENLNEAVQKFFQTDEMDIVDRLIEESLSQESQPDPVGDVLGPMEKVTLQNAATICKYVEPLPKPDFEDETLKQYRDAILANEVVEEGVPLSGSHNPIDVESIVSAKRKMTDDSANKRGVRSKKIRLNRF